MDKISLYAVFKIVKFAHTFKTDGTFNVCC